MQPNWYRCPSCGHASPDLLAPESIETPAWRAERIPCDTCGYHDVVLCPHCGRDYEPLGKDRQAVPPGAPPVQVERRPQEPHPRTWPPRSW